MEDEVKLDKWGYEIRTSSEACISAINAFYDQNLSYGRQRSVILEAPVHDKDCVLANILATHFLSSSDPSRAHFHLRAAESNLDHATSYEKAVFDAISCLISKDRDDDVAIKLHAELLNKFPRDLVSLKRAQVLCFYMGHADQSLALVQQVLPNNQEEDFFYGMLAFPLLELGRMAEAEEAARQGLIINKNDCWAQHAVCHVLQYRCHFKDAVEFMEACSPSWSSCSSFMLTHNWWHVALCYLEANSSLQKIIEIFDNYIWKELEKPDAVEPEVYLNALGLLLRVSVRGEIDRFEDRLKVIASALTNKAFWHIEWHLDLLMLWALAKTGEFSKAEDLLSSLKSRMSTMNKKKQEKMLRGMLLAEALYEYGRGSYEHALEFLGLDFDADGCKMIGASDEQLDVFNDVWYDILMNTGHTTKVIEVIEKKIKKREGVPYLWRLLERCYSITGRQEEAAMAGNKAKTMESSYFR